MTSGFIFVESPADFRDDPSLVVHLPRGLSSKQKLFSVLADKLRFPRYFGWNWDALDECLRGLSWLPSDRRVVLVHESLPFGSGGVNQQIYLDILRRVATGDGSESSRISVVFPSKLRDQINSVR